MGAIQAGAGRIGLAGRALVWVALAMVMTGSKCRKDDKPPDDTRTTDNTLEPVESRLQVAGIDPAVVTANQSIAAEIYGDGFAKGVQVQIGGSVLSSVTWTSATVLNVTVPGLPAGRYDVTVINPDGKRATQYGGLTVNTGGGGGGGSAGCAPLTVYFAFDSSAITADARSSLDIWADCVRKQDLQVRIEGHSDERGTTEYNMALGQRRADAVARHLSGLGLPKGRVAAVSYGEEKPAARGSGEESWAQNRRAELTARP